MIHGLLRVLRVLRVLRFKGFWLKSQCIRFLLSI